MSTLEQAPVEQEPPLAVVAWHPPPVYPPPKVHVQGATGGRAVAALISAIFGLVLGLPLGIPGMVLGTIAYFLGRSAVSQIDSAGVQAGRGLAVMSWVLGVVAMAIGSLVTLIWLVVLLLAASSPTTNG